MSNPRIAYQLASDRPPLPAFSEKTILVHLVVNIEHWQFDQPMPRTVLTPPHGREQVPDVPNFSWAEYGVRCGMPRLFDLFASRGVPASASLNAGVIAAYPSCADAILKAGWECIGHGMHQRSIQGEADEASVIRQSLDRIERFTGTRPRGWLSPGLRETFDTPDILRAEGVDYVLDWVLDDLPVWMATQSGPLLSIPYSLELNDSVIYAVERHAAGEMQNRFERLLKTVEIEARRQPRLVTLGLHPHLIAVPHRIGELVSILDCLLARDDVAFVQAAEIADWFGAAVPAERTGP